MRWVLQHKTPIAIILGIVVLIVTGIWFWGVLVGYVNPGTKGATDRKDVVQAFALIVAGVVAAIGGIVGIANLQTSRRNLQQQRDLEEQRAQEDVLQSYFEQMGDLLTDHRLLDTDREEIKLLAQAQTLTVLARLDGGRKGSLVRFLCGAGLINKDSAIVSLRDIDFSDTDLSDADFSNADLSGVNLSNSNLSRARLRNADLSSADLNGSDLRVANLGHAYLFNAFLAYADLTFATLHDADLTAAVLLDAKVTEEQLAGCKSLDDATMPNGQKYEDWLKTPDGQDWLRKYKKDLGTYMKRIGAYESWIQTTEGQMWRKAVEEDGENSGS